MGVAHHTPVTIGTGNGLSIVNQTLSLQLATASQNGALSSADWTTFNNKVSQVQLDDYIRRDGTTACIAPIPFDVGAGISVGSLLCFGDVNSDPSVRGGGIDWGYTSGNLTIQTWNQDGSQFAGIDILVNIPPPVIGQGSGGKSIRIIAGDGGSGTTKGGAGGDVYIQAGTRGAPVVSQGSGFIYLSAGLASNTFVPSYVCIGDSATAGHLVGSGLEHKSLFVGYALEVDGPIYVDNSIVMTDAKDFFIGTGTGSKFGQSSSKLAFYGATPISKPTSTTDLRAALINLGLYTTGGASPLNLNGGVFSGAASVGLINGNVGNFTPDALTATRTWTMRDMSGTVAFLSDISGGSALEVKSNNSQVDEAVTSLDFSTSFSLTESPAHEINISIINAVADGATKGIASFTASDFDSSSGNISIDYTNGQAASGSTKGFLSAADFTIFNNKVSGPGSSTNNAIAVWNGTTGKILQNSTISLIDGELFLGDNKEIVFGSSNNPSIFYDVGSNSLVLQQNDVPCNLNVVNFSTFITGSIQPQSDSAYFLGASGLGWDRLYIKTSGTGDGILNTAALGASRTWTLPNATGTVALTSDLALYIAKDGTTTTTASIPFAQGLSVANTKSLSFGGGLRTLTDNGSTLQLLAVSGNLQITAPVLFDGNQFDFGNVGVVAGVRLAYDGTSAFSMTGQAPSGLNQDGTNISLTGGDAMTFVVGNQNGGLVNLKGGARTNSGNDGYVRVGSTGTPNKFALISSNARSSLYVNQALEVDGAAYFDGGVNLPDSVAINFGTTGDAEAVSLQSNGSNLVFTRLGGGTPRITYDGGMDFVASVAEFVKFGPTATIQTTVAPNDKLSVAQVGDFTVNTRALLAVAEFTGTTTTRANGINAINAFVGTAATSNQRLSSTTLGGGLRNRYGITHNGSGQVDQCSAVTAVIQGSGTGTIIEGACYQSEGAITSAGTHTRMTGFWARGAALGGGTVATAIGFRLDAQTQGSVNLGMTFSSTGDGSSIHFNAGATPTAASTEKIGASASSTLDLYANTTLNHRIGGSIIGAFTSAGFAITGTLSNTGNATLANSAASSATIGATSSTAIHQIFGGLRLTSITITASRTIDTTTSDMFVLLNHSSAINITLPAHSAGRWLFFKDTTFNLNTNPATFVRNGGTGKIEGVSSSYEWRADGGFLALYDDGTDWWVVA